MPLRTGLPDDWEFGSDPEWVVKSPADVTDYVYMLVLRAMNGQSPDQVLEITTAGDGDWYLYDSGTSVRWKDRANSNSLIVSIGQDSFYVRSQGNDDLLVIDRQLSAIGFYGANPVAKQTGVAVTAEAIHAALVNLGLISA